jgi:hypothetical protein
MYLNKEENKVCKQAVWNKSIKAVKQFTCCKFCHLLKNVPYKAKMKADTCAAKYPKGNAGI